MECAGFPRAATVWLISASSVRAAVKRRGRQRAPVARRHEDKSDGQDASPRSRRRAPRPARGEPTLSSRPGSPADGRTDALFRRSREPRTHRSRPSPRLEPCLDERRLAGEAGARHDDGASFPADDASVYEEVVRRALRDEGLRVCCQRPPASVNLRASATRFVPAYTRYDGHAPPDAPVRSSYRTDTGASGSWSSTARQPNGRCRYRILFESVEQRPTVDAESDPHAVRNEVAFDHLVLYAVSPHASAVAKVGQYRAPRGLRQQSRDHASARPNPTGLRPIYEISWKRCQFGGHEVLAAGGVSGSDGKVLASVRDT